jgi:hypothetical protein
MRHVLLLCGALSLTFVVSACSGSPVTPTPAVSAPEATPPVGPASTSSETFAYTASATPYQPAGYTLSSRFVLNDNGTFALQYPSGLYRGTYTQKDGAITFQWEGWSLAGPWGATGIREGDRLTVRYNVIMQLSDFEDAVYTLVK